jgi:hypothetical protein
MASLAVDDIIAEARTHLQDADGTRYSTASLLRELENALLDLRRTRPDLFLGSLRTAMTPIVAGTNIPVDEMFRPSLSLYVAGRAQIRDEEASPDSRAGVLVNSAKAQWLQP